ncbi:hypothetical protein LTR56_012949 [Elasticomyces elasticus]|nr:hypothetical protein LTR56_012949 [Elasticomyces elasticus]KAK3667981.1 hypothetical protein LTR22_001048 [Elasticomyces elasticus]KAK4925078.1 hypothetical protein LTR49_007851 [Elasticomyces elasticus]KAK5767621.1 hypothetical protein LTS12_002122 [Elasticomyces elasticus]
MNINSTNSARYQSTPQPRRPSMVTATETTSLLKALFTRSSPGYGSSKDGASTAASVPSRNKAVDRLPTPISTASTRQQAALRPPTARAATASAATNHTSTATPTPVMSRPILNRSSVTSSSSMSHTNKPSARPSLLRRATDPLDLNPATSYTQRHAPPTPSHWTDHAHLAALLKIWDSVHAAPSTSKYPLSITAQVVDTEKQMLLAYAELAEGAELLTTTWIEYKLGVCSRRPFCTAERMGRFELLSSSAGSRGQWGPW